MFSAHSFLTTPIISPVRRWSLLPGFRNPGTSENLSLAVSRTAALSRHIRAFASPQGGMMTHPDRSAADHAGSGLDTLQWFSSVASRTLHRIPPRPRPTRKVTSPAKTSHTRSPALRSPWMRSSAGRCRLAFFNGVCSSSPTMSRTLFPFLLFSSLLFSSLVPPSHISLALSLHNTTPTVSLLFAVGLPPPSRRAEDLSTAGIKYPAPLDPSLSSPCPWCAFCVE